MEDPIRSDSRPAETGHESVVRQRREEQQKNWGTAWKRKHEQFHDAMRAARADGGDGEKGPVKLMQCKRFMHKNFDGTVTCPHCIKSFSGDDAEAHISRCATKKPTTEKRVLLLEKGEDFGADVPEPPSKMRLRRVEPDGWADRNGLVARKAEILAIHGKRVADLTPDDLEYILGDELLRPLKVKVMVKIDPPDEQIMQGAPSRALRQQQPEEEMDDRVPCPHCGRKFGENAAEKHIAICLKVFGGKNKANEAREEKKREADRQAERDEKRDAERDDRRDARCREDSGSRRADSGSGFHHDREDDRDRRRDRRRDDSDREDSDRGRSRRDDRDRDDSLRRRDSDFGRDPDSGRESGSRRDRRPESETRRRKSQSAPSVQDRRPPRSRVPSRTDCGQRPKEIYLEQRDETGFDYAESPTGSVVVKRLGRGSESAYQGLRVGDVLTELNGRRVADLGVDEVDDEMQQRPLSIKAVPGAQKRTERARSGAASPDKAWDKNLRGGKGDVDYRAKCEQLEKQLKEMEHSMAKAVEDERKQRRLAAKEAERELQEERKLRRRLEKQVSGRASSLHATLESKVGKTSSADAFASVRGPAMGPHATLDSKVGKMRSGGLPLDLKRAVARKTRYASPRRAHDTAKTPPKNMDNESLQSQLLDEKQKQLTLVEQQRKELQAERRHRKTLEKLLGQRSEARPGNLSATPRTVGSGATPRTDR